MLRREPSAKMQKNNQIQKPSGALLDLVKKHAIKLFLSLGSSRRSQLVHCRPIGAPANLAQASVRAWLKLTENSHKLICNDGHKAIVVNPYAATCAQKHPKSVLPHPRTSSK